MYGSVSRWRVKEGKQEEFEKLGNELMQDRDRPTGSRSVLIYRADADPREYWIAGVFDSREAYTASSASPEQNARFQRLRDLMELEPEWHDGEVIASY